MNSMMSDWSSRSDQVLTNPLSSLSTILNPIATNYENIGAPKFQTLETAGIHLQNRLYQNQVPYYQHQLKNNIIHRLRG